VPAKEAQGPELKPHTEKNKTKQKKAAWKSRLNKLL
jgi:hypothetical protein